MLRVDLFRFTGIDLSMLRLTAFVFLASMTPAKADGTISAAGRMEQVTGTGGCSAVLIRHDLIATAAHCQGARRRLVFRPGDGIDGETYLVAELVRHPLYDQSVGRVDWKYRFDIAVGRLARSVPASRATPFLMGDDAKPAEQLFIVSWRRDGTDRPRQRACPVIPGIPGLVTLGCEVRGGESGAPVLRKTPDGLELVAIISSRTRQLEQPIAQASNVRLRLQPIIDMIDAKRP